MDRAVWSNAAAIEFWAFLQLIPMSTHEKPLAHGLCNQMTSTSFRSLPMSTESMQRKPRKCGKTLNDLKQRPIGQKGRRKGKGPIGARESAELAREVICQTQKKNLNDASYECWLKPRPAGATVRKVLKESRTMYLICFRSVLTPRLAESTRFGLKGKKNSFAR